MFRIIFCVLISIIFFLNYVVLAEAKKLALLIGNKTYEISRFNLKNPHNDVDRVGRALIKVGFQVKIIKDGSLSQIQRETKRYARRLREAGKGAVGFFYYSGHGAMDESTKTNYIVPVDVRSTTTTELWDDSIRLDTITNNLKSQATNAVHIVVFDACRSELKLRNPNTKSLGNTKGFSAVGIIRGMLIAYATAEGETATDSGDSIGHYARILAQELVKPGVEVATMFRNVQLRVSESIRQEPWLRYSALPKLYLAGRRKHPVIGGSDNEEIAALRRQLSTIERLRQVEKAELNRLRKKKEKREENERLDALSSANHIGMKNEKLDRFSSSYRSSKKDTSSADPYKHGYKFQDCPKCPKMIMVRGDTFWMGSKRSEEGRERDEGPRHEVNIKKLAVGRFEVTFAEWDACVSDGGCGC